MSDFEFYSSIGFYSLVFYVLPIILFFYLKHLYKKYSKPKETLSEEEIKEYQKIKDLEKLAGNRDGEL